MYYVYMVRCDDNSLYTGITTDVKRRMNEHFYKLKEAASYTKSRNVVSLEALWSCENRSMASKLEYKIKRFSKDKKESLIKDPEVFDEYKYIKDRSIYVQDIKMKDSK